MTVVKITDILGVAYFTKVEDAGTFSGFDATADTIVAYEIRVGRSLKCWKAGHQAQRAEQITFIQQNVVRVEVV